MSLTSLVAIAAIAFAGSHAQAQGSYKKELPDALTKVAKVTESVAAATAQARVPNGKIQGVELEREKDRLIYSYDIKTAGKTGIDEVHVDASAMPGPPRCRLAGQGDSDCSAVAVGV